MDLQSRITRRAAETHAARAIHNSQFTIHHSPFTIYHSPFTIYHSSSRSDGFNVAAGETHGKHEEYIPSLTRRVSFALHKPWVAPFPRVAPTATLTRPLTRRNSRARRTLTRRDVWYAVSVGCTLSVGFTHGYIQMAANAAKSTGYIDADGGRPPLRRRQ